MISLQNVFRRAVSLFAISVAFVAIQIDGYSEDLIPQESHDSVIENEPDFVLSENPTARSIPGRAPPTFPEYVYESLPDINSSSADFAPVPDRWRMLYKGRWYDPYNQNILKGDLPVFGSQSHPWFIELSLVSDSLYEYRRLPLPVGVSSTNSPQSNDVFGSFRQSGFLQSIIPSIGIISGNTTFRPPTFEFRFTPVFNVNYADIGETGILKADPDRGTDRTDAFTGVLDLFVDTHIADISKRYDFISMRAGVQRFNSDFRGFVYNTEEPGVRLFGNWDENRWQYNAAWFHRIDKDTNSGLNSYFEDRYEDVVIANFYRQDAIADGNTINASILHREDNAGAHGQEYDSNGFLVRPTSIGDERAKDISSTYLGLSTDGHFDRVNITSAFYYVYGSESHNSIAKQQVDISAAMGALEVSLDSDWIRYRGSLFWASGDSNADDSVASGFDSIVDNPNFAGGDFSFFQRNGLPFIGGGVTNLVNRGSLLPSFRPGKEQGQANFVNPGLRLYNLGVDFELTPKVKLINNASFLQFDEVEPIQVSRHDGSISRDVGFDLSSGVLYRPFLNQNVQFRAGAGFLLPSAGIKNLYGDETLFNIFTNMILVY